MEDERGNLEELILEINIDLVVQDDEQLEEFFRGLPYFLSNVAEKSFDRIILTINLYFDYTIQTLQINLRS